MTTTFLFSDKWQVPQADGTLIDVRDEDQERVKWMVFKSIYDQKFHLNLNVNVWTPDKHHPYRLEVEYEIKNQYKFAYPENSQWIEKEEFTKTISGGLWGKRKVAVLKPGSGAVTLSMGQTEGQYQEFMRGLVKQDSRPELEKRDYRKFYTYPETAAYMVQLAEVEIGMRILEPSAGEGAIIIAVKNWRKDVTVHAVEINKDNRRALAEAGADTLTTGDFLEYKGFRRYDRVIANPPFGNGIDLDAHISRMYELLKHGGRMVVLIPTTFKDPDIAYTIPLQNWSKNSDGTITEICLAVYNKPPVPAEQSGQDESQEELAQEFLSRFLAYPAPDERIKEQLEQFHLTRKEK